VGGKKKGYHLADQETPSRLIGVEGGDHQRRGRSPEVKVLGWRTARNRHVPFFLLVCWDHGVCICVKEMPGPPI
jgi:hypothetical protein